MLRSLWLVFLLAVAFCADPPIYNYPYYTSFEMELYSSFSNGNSTCHGQEWIDPNKGLWRVDRGNGKDNDFCGTVIPGQSTPCIHYYIDGKMWLVFPDRYECCFCCEASRGCGIAKPDFFKDAKYEGAEAVDHVDYDKWQKEGKSVHIQPITRSSQPG